MGIDPVADAITFELLVQEAVIESAEFIPVYSRSPLTPLQLIQAILKFRIKMAAFRDAAEVPAVLRAGFGM